MCSSIMSPLECWGLGTSQDTMGHAMCAWDSEDNICLSIEVGKPEGICQIYNYRRDWAGCQKSLHCYYDESDVECTEDGEMEVPPPGSAMVIFGEDGYPEHEFEFDHEMEHEHEFEHPEMEYEYPEYEGPYHMYNGGVLQNSNPGNDKGATDYTPVYYGLAGFLSAIVLVCGFYTCVRQKNKATFEDVYQDIALDYDYSSRDKQKVDV